MALVSSSGLVQCHFYTPQCHSFNQATSGPKWTINCLLVSLFIACSVLAGTTVLDASLASTMHGGTGSRMQ